jgi:hypothetical protein
MTIEQSAMFLASSILVGLGTIVLIIMVLVINNLFVKFWKPVDVSKHMFPNSQALEKGLNSRFADAAEPTAAPKIEPTIEPDTRTARAKK